MNDISPELHQNPSSFRIQYRNRLEYELKEEWNEKMIMQLKDRVEVLEETTDILKEEIKITSAMIQDGTEADAMLDELNAKLVELQNRKPKTTVIVKEVEVPTKKKKWYITPKNKYKVQMMGRWGS